MDRRHDRPAREDRTAPGAAAAHVGVAKLRAALGVLWLLDGALQLQPSMFTQGFVTARQQSVMAQPPWVAHSILWATRVVGPHIAAWNLAFAALQLGIGAAILCRRTAKVALAVSCVWASAVWWFGEGFGNVLTGFGSILAGSPGAALLSVLVALAVWPVQTATGGEAPAGLLGDVRACWVWALLWCGDAYLQIRPGLPLPYRVAANFQETSIGEPAIVARLDHALGHLGQHWGSPLSFGLAALEIVIGIGVLAGARRRLLLGVGMGLLAITWVVGENMGGMLTGSGTDPGAAPLFGLLAIALWRTPPSERVLVGLDPGTPRF